MGPDFDATLFTKTWLRETKCATLVNAVAAVTAVTASKGDSIEMLALDDGADNNIGTRSHTEIN